MELVWALFLNFLLIQNFVFICDFVIF